MKSGLPHQRGGLFNSVRFQLYAVDCFCRWMHLNFETAKRMHAVKRASQRRLINHGVPASDLGRRLCMPSSVPGSAAYQRRLIADGMAVIDRLGRPTFFLTFTANPLWPDIKAELLPNQDPGQRPDLCCRAFHERLYLLLATLRDGSIFGARTVYLMHVVESQLQGLLHAHLAFRLSGPQPVGEQIDFFISAEVPRDEDYEEYAARIPNLSVPEFQRLRSLVRKHMIHRHVPGRCWPKDAAPSARRCKYHFPFDVQPVTTLDERGFVRYRRRREEDIFVVAYSPVLLLRYGAHLNLQIAHSVKIVKYLRKVPLCTRQIFLLNFCVVDFLLLLWK